MLTEHMCVSYVNKEGGEAFARPIYYISHRNQLTSTVPVCSFLGQGRRDKRERGSMTKTKGLTLLPIMHL